jgi:hypothetical protein
MIYCTPEKCALCLLIPRSEFCFRRQARRCLEISKRVYRPGVHAALEELGLALLDAAHTVEQVD